MNVPKRLFLSSLSRAASPYTLNPSSSISCTFRRHRSTAPSRPIPPPIPFVPDLPTFFRLIGRSMSEHTSKFPTWEAFFTTPSEDFRTLGIEPARARRYLLGWRERYRQGNWGPGGDFTEVDQEGVAYLRVIQVPRPKGETSEATALLGENMMRLIANVPKDSEVPEGGVMNALAVQGYELGEDTLRIRGPGALPVKGGDGQLVKVTAIDRMWEIRQGKKKDGGERRSKEVRAKKAAEERKKAREAEAA